MNRVKGENYIQIQGWMVTELKLKGNELLVYALIYGFSQDGKSRFTGTQNYIAGWVGSSKNTVKTVLKSLTEKKLLKKHDVTKNKVKYCDYQALIPSDFTPPGQNLAHPHGPKSAHTYTKSNKEKENRVKEKTTSLTSTQAPQRKNLFAQEYTQKTEDLETHINPFLENFGKNKPMAPLSIVGQQIEEVTNITRLSRQDRKCIGNHLSRLAQYAGDQVGWRLIGELKESMAGGNVRVPLAILITKIKQCIPEVCGVQGG